MFFTVKSKKKKREKRKSEQKERNATPLEINYAVTRAFSAFSGLSLFAINALVGMHTGEQGFLQIVSVASIVEILLLVRKIK